MNPKHISGTTMFPLGLLVTLRLGAHLGSHRTREESIRTGTSGNFELGEAHLGSHRNGDESKGAGTSGTFEVGEAHLGRHKN